MGYIAIIDFETTGLLKDGERDWLKQPGIVQMGVSLLDLDTLKEVATINSFVNPDIAEEAWEPGAIATHKIIPGMVKNTPSLLGHFQDFAGMVVGSRFWCGYNVPFDKGILWHQLNRYGLERNFPWPPQDIDVMTVVTKELGTVRGKRHGRWKLVDAYREIIGHDYEGAHDGLADCRATGEILRKIGGPYLG